MLKNRNMWLKVAAVIVLSLPSLSLFAGTSAVRSSTPASALSGLTSGSSFENCVQLPAVPEIQAPVSAAEKTAALNTGLAPEPGRDFDPLVDDAIRVKAMMRLVSDIYYGKPLPYAQDGSTFKNKEGKLPAKPAGFYKEYTLLTGSAPHTVNIGGTSYEVAPDLSARGSERVIVGGGEKIYYTPDHYAHFIPLTVVY